MIPAQTPPPLLRFNFGTILILMGATCLPVHTVTAHSIPRDVAKFQAKLEALDGKTGEFEGVFTPGLHEGARFEFCTENECPDMKELDCAPNFSDQAATEMQKLWDERDGERIYMLASGTIRTGAKTRDVRGYGHLNQQACEIEIFKVSRTRVVDGLLVRSKEFPDLTKSLK
ncbi:MAG TPA: hypothetical protein VF503_31820 [Sphingobium sp.]|uniref:hypothetical protein n=1 Tax=Sphingobium sp. TaxID=1912891 RepID=UPI002ED633CB